MTTPTTYEPKEARDFLGSAGIHATVIFRKIDRIISDEKAFVRYLYYGNPGLGKTSLAMAAALKLGGSPFAVEQRNGQSVGVDVVRDWRASSPYRSMHGSGWACKVIDEVDRMSEAAVFELHSLLDLKTPRSAFFLTTNKEPKELLASFQTRAQLCKFKPVEPEAVTILLGRFDIPQPEALEIATANAGNVRGALFDAESWLDNNAVAQK